MGKGLLGPNGKSCGGKGRRCGSMAVRGSGWLAKHSIVSNEVLGSGGLVVRGGGGEVIGSGVNFGVIKSSSGEILDETMGERGGDIMGLGGGPVWFKLQYCADGFVSSMCSMEPSFSNEGNQLLQNYRKLFVLMCAYMKTMWQCGHIDSKE
ncbi:hypothetical protein Tco_0739960 [Tanacetum coccineum]